uniref:F-box/LRR-repeat protein 15/At3g58940/PEG3-like LRR domain-containing protein n=1 Tax=Aegilops tauschii subsp. strangulata TaxID=200361 RepID=A0A453KZ40_AEGTS
TLRIIVTLCLFEGKGKLVIKEAPHLERLLLRSPGLGVETIQVVRAPKLETVGLLSPCTLQIQINNLVFQVAASVSRLVRSSLAFFLKTFLFLNNYPFVFFRD